MNHQIYHSKLNQSLNTNNELLIVLAQSPILAQPRKGSLYHSLPRQDRKTFNLVIAFHNLQHQKNEISSPVDELTCISTIGPDQRQTAKTSCQFTHSQFSTITMLNIGCVHHHGHNQTQRTNHQMAFSATCLLASVIASVPSFETVLTDWLSMMAALGLAWRPAMIGTA